MVVLEYQHMTGVIYGRSPSDPNGDIHLWRMNGDRLVSYCGEFEGEIIDTANSSVLASIGGSTREFRVTQKESLQQAVSHYCDDCLAEFQS